MAGWNEKQLQAFDLTDWLLEAGESIARRIHSAADLETIGQRDRLLYEAWIFDMEQQNGGVSQYFCNRPIHQWESFFSLASRNLPIFETFAVKVNAVVERSSDPYASVVDSGIDLDGYYEEIRVSFLSELRSLAQQSTASGT